MGIELRGQPLAKAIKETITRSAAALTAKGHPPRLAVVLATDDPAAASYAQAKIKTAASLGIALDLHDLDGQRGAPGAGVTQAQLETKLRALGDDPKVHGILLELPLAKGLDADRAMECIPPHKDVDGLTLANLGRITQGAEARALLPATPQACIELAESLTPLAGKRVAVIGRGRTVGKPLVNLLINRHATVTVCHSRTPDLARAIADCEVVFVAIGQARLIRAEHAQAHQIWIDAGISVPAGQGTVQGDVDAESVLPVVRALSPVPGGVGPVTSAIIFRNLVRAAEMQIAHEAAAATATPADTTTRSGASHAESLWHQTMAQFRDATASAAPTPGGGSVSMVSATHGLGLVVMALEISARRKAVEPARLAELQSVLEPARAQLQKLAAHADADIHAFNAYMAAFSLPKSSEAEKSARHAAIQLAARGATEAPLAAARDVLASLELARAAATRVHFSVVSDVGAGAHLLGAALRAVLLNVDINLSSLAESERASFADERRRLAEAGDQAAARVVADVAQILSAR